MAVRGETSWRPRRQCPSLRHQRPACVSGSPESEARGLRGQGGRIQRGQSSTQTTRGPGPHWGFIQHHFVSIQTVQKEVTSLWGRGARKSSPRHRWGGPGCRQQGQVAPRMAQCVARGQDLPLRRCCELSVGVLPRVPRPGRCKGKPLPSCMSSASSASTTLTASRAEPQAEQTHHGHQAGEEGTVSEGPQSTTDGTGGLAHTQEEESSSERSLQKGSARQEEVTWASRPIQMKA